MSRSARTSTLAFVVALAAGCDSAAVSPLQPGAEPSLSLVTSECGGKTALLDSRIDLAWPAPADATSAIRSDGGGVYMGGSGGVHGKLFYYDSSCSRSADAVFDPDFNKSSAPRKLVFHFPANSIGLATSGVKSGPFMNFQGIMRLGSDVTWDAGQPVGRDARLEEKSPGSARSLEHPATTVSRPGYPEYLSATVKWGFGTDIKGCERLEYDSVTFSRTGGLDGFVQKIGAFASSDGKPLGEWSPTVWGTWTVESAAVDLDGDAATTGDVAHWAQCYKSVGGKLVANGAKLAMPFRVTVAERR